MYAVARCMGETDRRARTSWRWNGFGRKTPREGVVTGPVSDAQKAEIAEVRQVAEARLAELKILHQSALAGAFDPAAREALESEYRRDVRARTDDRERKIAKIRERPA